MLDAFQNVIANPASIAARRGLAELWTREQHPQGRLLFLELRDRFSDLAWDAHLQDRKEIRELVDEHGREWAGWLAEIVSYYKYHLGMIGGITLTGEQFVQHGARICAHFPIVHLGLSEPLCLDKVCTMPQLAQMRSLYLGAVGDSEAALLATCPYLTNLRSGALGKHITAVGMQALAASPYVGKVIAIDVTGNPGASSAMRGLLFTKQINDSVYLLGPAAIPLYNDALDEAAKGYNCETPDWPPSDWDVAWTD